MTFRHILVHVDKSEASAPRVDAAAAIATRLDAKLTAYYSVCDPNVPSMASHNRAMFIQREAGMAEAAFRLHMASTTVDATWEADIENTEFGVSRAVVFRARTADIVVLGQFDAVCEGTVPAGLVADTVQHAGRPVLVLPHVGHFPHVGQRVAIAWNGSREAARAVHDALPLLVHAEAVTVMEVLPDSGSEDAPQFLPDALIRHLEEHGVKAAADCIPAAARKSASAERLLSHAADHGADLLVMGAAGQQHSRWGSKRSVTDRVLAAMTIPVLLSY